MSVGRARLFAIALALTVPMVAPACSDGGPAGTDGLPGVVGEALPDALEILAKAGYTNVTTHRVDGGDPGEGFERDYDVETQSPGAGSDIAKDAPIDLGIRYRGLASPAT